MHALWLCTLVTALAAQQPSASDTAVPSESSLPVPPAAEPPAPAAESPAPAAEPTEAVEAPAPALVVTPPSASARPRLRRVAVQRVEAADVPARVAPLFTAALVSELRKLHGVSVIGMDEVEALLEAEANRQALGCDSDGCTAELADALGADSVVTARLARLGDESVLSFRRLDVADGAAHGHDRRVARGDGEELLSEIGPAVEALFPEQPIRVGMERGVDREMGRRLNPPPVPVWAFAVSAGATGVALATAAGAGLFASALTSSVQARVDGSVEAPVDGADLTLDFERAERAALVSNVALLVGGAGVVTTGALALFTDFWGYANE